MTGHDNVTRPLRRAAGGGAVVAFVLFTLLLTYGRPWNLLPRETLGNFYDAQAQSFRSGRLDVDPAVLSFEGFRVGEKTFEYQGPVPALMRLPVVLVTDRLDGRLTRISMLVAYGLTLCFVVKLQLLGRRVVRGTSPLSPGEALWTGIATAALGTSSILFLASKAWVYHEALLWGVAFSLGSFAYLGTWLARPEQQPAMSANRPGRSIWGDRNVVIAAALAGLALLTRSAVGAGPMAALLLVGGVQITHLMIARRWPRFGSRIASAAGWRHAGQVGLATLGLGVLIPVGLYMGINHAKFGTLLSLPAEKQVLVQFDETRQEFFASNNNSLFGVKFLPSVARQAFRPDAVSLGGPFPFVGFPRERPTAVGGVLFAERDWSASLPVTGPLPFLAGLLGVCVLLAPRRLAPSGDAAVLRMPVLAAGAGGAGFFVIGYIANRYLNDLYPLVVLAAVIGMPVIAERAASASTALRRVVTGGLVLATLWGAWVNLGIGLEYQRVIAPGTTTGDRADWLRLQSYLGPDPEIVRVELLEPLPEEPGLGDVAIVGNCDAVYRSNGSIWLPIEGGPTSGRFRGDLILEPPASAAITVLGADGPEGFNRLVLEAVGEGQGRFVATVERDGQVTRSLAGPTFELEQLSDDPIDITFDWRSGYAEVLQGDRELLASNIALVPAVPSVSPDLNGSFPQGVPKTPLCDALT